MIQEIIIISGCGLFYLALHIIFVRPAKRFYKAWLLYKDGKISIDELRKSQ